MAESIYSSPKRWWLAGIVALSAIVVLVIAFELVLPRRFVWDDEAVKSYYAFETAVALSEQEAEWWLSFRLPKLQTIDRVDVPMVLNRNALEFAKLVDRSVLAHVHPSLPKHFDDEFVRALTIRGKWLESWDSHQNDDSMFREQSRLIDDFFGWCAKNGNSFQRPPGETRIDRKSEKWAQFIGDLVGDAGRN